MNDEMVYMTFTGRTLRGDFGSARYPKHIRLLPFLIDTAQSEALIAHGVQLTELDMEFVVNIRIPSWMEQSYVPKLSTPGEVDVILRPWHYEDRSGTAVFLVRFTSRREQRV